jgi:hypothetical protein
VGAVGGPPARDPGRGRRAVRVARLREPRGLRRLPVDRLVTWRAAPGWLGLRGRASGDYFRITRDELSFVAGATPTVTPTREQQIEAHGRLFVDLDVLSFGGFVPAAWLGADLLSIQGAPTGAASALVPVLGVGIVRP